MNTVRLLLIVDDDADDRALLAEAFDEIDATMHCMEAENGEDALEKLSLMPALPDLIFLDINMPKMNGKQFLQALKNDARWHAIPVVVYTTSKSRDDVEDMQKLGAMEYIVKPTSFPQIVAVLEQAFQHVGFTV